MKTLFALLMFAAFAATAAIPLPELNWVPGSDWLNVKNFGAKGDGTTDDTAALQKAFDAVQDGTVIYFPPGVYPVSSELVIIKKPPFKGKEKRLLGTGIYGHGRNTVLRWQGKADGTILRDRGMLHCRMIGLTFDGSGKAAAGLNHDNDNKFETHLYYAFCEFRNFSKFGVLSEKNSIDGLSTAEIAFEHTIFDNCGTAISFTSFNDYNYTFDGCRFANNKAVAVECVNGNFYVRNSRFENNGTDVAANPEHASSIRRSVSVNAGTFLKFGNSVSPMTVENCYVADWRDAAAITSFGAPLTLFDNTFRHADAQKAPLQANRNQFLLLAANTLLGPSRLTAGESPRAITVPLPEGPLPLNADTDFIPAEVKLPTALFDAKTQFGARGDGRADDTEAIQKALDAAGKHGNGAIAYLPRGISRTTRPLELTGSGFGLGGTGLYSEILFAGKPEENAINVRPSGELLLDNFAVNRYGLKFNADRTVSGFGGTGADIRQFPSETGSRVTYHSVYVRGKYSHMPFLLGFRLENLTARDTVILDNIEGNIHAINSGAATIFAPVSYEGTVWIKGKASGGIFGIMTRLATLSEYSIHLENSSSLIASDFYIEQAIARTITLKGGDGDAPGRVTLGLAKLDINRDGNASMADELVAIDRYNGEINFIASQLYPPKYPAKFTVAGDKARLGIFSSFFYVKSFRLVPENLPLELLATGGSSEFNKAALTLPGAAHNPAAAVNALLDLRRLGRLDWQLNYPALLAR